MRKAILFYLTLIFLSASIISCNKKDDPKDPDFYLKVGDTVYELSSGILEAYGDQEDVDIDGFEFEGYNLDMYLTSKGISEEKTLSGNLDITGKGQVLYFELISSTIDGLTPGVYTFSTTSPIPAISISYSDYSLDWREEESWDEVWIDVVSGQLTVARSGSTYEITIDCTDINGKKIEGYYKGSLLLFEYYSGKKGMKARSGNARAFQQ